MTHRKPRPPIPVNGLPATFIEAEEARIRSILINWRQHHEMLFTMKASHEVFVAFFLEKLQINKGSLDAVYIVDLALRGHPAADIALRQFIVKANEENQFQTLPLSVRAYNSRLVLLPLSTPGYPSQAPKTIDNFNRDWAIGWLIDAVKEGHPGMPLLYSSNRRHSAAHIVGSVFGISEVQAQRISRGYKGRFEAVARFFLGNTISNGLAPIV